LRDEIALGDLVIVESALCEDGASRALGAEQVATPDPDLLDALRGRNGRRAGLVVSTDLFYDPDPARWRDTGALAHDLETAALLTVASRREARAASVLAVRRNGDSVIEADALEAAELELGRLAVASLTH
jgi:uridine phosphorylase